MNVIARLEFKLVYYDSAVHRFNHYTTRTPQGMEKFTIVLSYIRGTRQCQKRGWVLSVNPYKRWVSRFHSHFCWLGYKVTSIHMNGEWVNLSKIWKKLKLNEENKKQGSEYLSHVFVFYLPCLTISHHQHSSYQWLCYTQRVLGKLMLLFTIILW